MGGERTHAHAPRHRCLERVNDLHAIEPEDQNVDRFTRLLDGCDDGGDASIWLNDELHYYPSSFQQFAGHLGRRASTRDYRPFQRTRSPPLTSRGVPIVEGLV